MKKMNFLLMVGLSIQLGQVAAPKAFASADAEQKELISFSRFVDETAKLNIEQVYLKNAKLAYSISKSEKLSHQQKQAQLFEVLKSARESLEVQKEDPAYYIVSPLVHYKLGQFQSAVAAGDFERTAEMAKSVQTIALHLMN